MSEPVYAPNSHKSREQKKEEVAVEKRVRKVTQGPVKTKTNGVRKLTDIFISEDVSNVKSYIFMDVLVPAIKKALYDIVTNGFDMLLYGSSGRGKGGGNTATKVNYRNYYRDEKNSGYRERGSESAKNNNSSFDYDDIVFRTRGEAEDAKQQLQDIIAKYGVATVNDLYEMTPLTPPYTAANYGWMDLSNVEVRRDRDGYVLKLPRAASID
jgi:hypothetical protein